LRGRIHSAVGARDAAVADEGCIDRLVELARRESDHRVRSVGFGRAEDEPVQLEKEHANDEPGSLVAVYERMISNDADRVRRRHLDDARSLGVGPQLPRARQGGFEQRGVPQPRRPAVQREQTVVDRQGVAFVDPDRVVPAHFARTWSVLR
jgi:hypothetical protein